MALIGPDIKMRPPARDRDRLPPHRHPMPSVQHRFGPPLPDNQSRRGKAKQNKQRRDPRHNSERSVFHRQTIVRKTSPGLPSPGSAGAGETGQSWGRLNNPSSGKYRAYRHLKRLAALARPGRVRPLSGPCPVDRPDTEAVDLTQLTSTKAAFTRTFSKKLFQESLPNFQRSSASNLRKSKQVPNLLCNRIS
jgi:hypothetical protein